MERKRSRSRAMPDFKPSGILGKYENRRNGEIMLYSEPLDGRMPLNHWRMYQFKGDDSSSYELHTQSYFSIGRDPTSHIKLNHSSISKQHAVIQFKSRKGDALPYLIDLNSKTGCQLNGERIDSSRFYELRSKDIITFGTLDDEFALVRGDKLNNTE